MDAEYLCKDMVNEKRAFCRSGNDSPKDMTIVYPMYSTNHVWKATEWTFHEKVITVHQPMLDGKNTKNWRSDYLCQFLSEYSLFHPAEMEF